jgi:hypothetical protein
VTVEELAQIAENCRRVAGFTVTGLQQRSA